MEIENGSIEKYHYSRGVEQTKTIVVARLIAVIDDTHN
jgi:hypothetical protein